MLYSKYTLAITIALLLFSCKEPSDHWPDDLEGKKEFLTGLKGELTDLEVRIAKLTDKIAEEDPSLTEKSRLINAANLTSRTFNKYIEIEGTVVADEYANVTSEVPGRITSLSYKEGDYIKKGALVAKIDMESMRKQIAEIETSLHLARDVYERQERLWNQKIGSEVQYLQTKNNVERLEKSIETINQQLSKELIYAPISGVVDREFLKQGEVAAPGMPILKILDTYRLKVVANLPERYLTTAKKGLPVDLHFPSLGQEMSGRVTQLGRSIDPANRTLELEIAPSKRSNLLKPNLLTEIRIKELTIKDAIFIPSEYILQQVNGQQYVYTIMSSNNEYRAKKTMITTGPSFQGNIVVTSGLSAGDLIATSGTRTINDGELIEIKETTTLNIDE